MKDEIHNRWAQYEKSNAWLVLDSLVRNMRRRNRHGNHPGNRVPEVYRESRYSILSADGTVRRVRKIKVKEG